MLKKLFSPTSIAVIGASHSRQKLGHVILKNLLTHKFRGRLYPVNPKGGTILGKKVFASVADIPTIPDLGIIAIPAGFVQQALIECGRKRIRQVIIITAGFGETGEKGKSLEREIVETARRYHIRILGPNCLGIIVPGIRMNASFAEGLPEKGNVAILSQSGAMAVAITDWALSSKLGFSALVSLGNKSDISEEELLVHFGKDASTNVIVMYLENLSTGRSFLRALKRVSRRKPVIILKPGKSERARHAVTSHTGAIAGSHDTELAALASAGAIMAHSLEDLFTYAVLFEKRQAIRGTSVAVVTNAGGPGILMTDALDAHDIPVANFSDSTKKILRSKLPETAAVDNPVDVIGDAPAERYRSALSAVIKDPNVHAVIVLLTHQYVTETEKVADIIIAMKKKFPKIPILASFIGGKGVEKGRLMLGKEHIPQFAFPDQAAQALGALFTYQDEKKISCKFPDTQEVSGWPAPKIGSDAERFARRYIPYILPSKTVLTIESAHKAANSFGYPVVAKVVSKKYIHKTDFSLVKVNITSGSELARIIRTWNSFLRSPFSSGEGFFIQPYRPADLEILVGAKRDKKIGPTVVVGLGGIFAEAFTNPSILPVPFTRQQAERALSQKSLGRVLSGKRGRKLNKSRLVSIMLGLSKLMMEHPEVSECDLNPVMLTQKEAYVADVRLVTLQK